ncbi:MAG: hypothetical protein K9M44_03850 [Candidatus Pacebacteria bacterium]|nr:hypothetical protein [Candidatus Paceibacterota bacterium]
MKIKSDNIELEKAIVKTMAFFDLFSYPLTSLEIWQYLSIDIDYKEFQSILNSLRLRAVVFKQAGYYFFPDRAEIIQIRKKRYNYFQQKLKLIKKWSGFFKFISGAKAIFIGNIIGTNNLRREGDIDLFVICKENQVWRTRFILTLVAKLFGLRPSRGQEKDKFCLSFFASQKALDFSNLRLDPDPYFSFWLLGLREAGKKDKYFNKVLTANNYWLKNEFPNYFKIFKVEDDLKSNEAKEEFVLKGLEKKLYKLQWKLFPQEIKSKANKSTEVVLGPQILKLHVLDRRQEFYNKYLRNIKKYESFL